MWAAPLYRLTGRIETAKAFSIPLMVAAGLSVFGCLLLASTLRPWVAALLAAVAAANPVALVQLLNFYQDGALASLLTVCAASSALWAGTRSRTGLALAMAAGVGAGAVKLTGPVFAVVLVGAALAWKLRTRARRELRAFAVALVAAVPALLLLSGGTYLTNIVRHGHPMYPVFGPDRTAIVEFPPHKRVQTLLASVVSRSARPADGATTIEDLQAWRGIKPPFVFDRNELWVFMSPWVGVGGWGPLFSGVALIGAMLLVASAVRRPARIRWILVLSAPLVISVLVHPLCWNARFVPQVWLVPLVIVVIVLAAPASRAEKLLAAGVIAAAGLNAALVSWAHVPAVVSNSRALQANLLRLQDLPGPLRVDFGPFRSNRVRLAELGIDVLEVNDPGFSLPVYNGYAPAVLVRSQVIETAGDRLAVALEWRPTEGADRYLLEALGRDGSAVVRERTSAPEAVVTVPRTPIDWRLSICNRLGCCAPKKLNVPNLDPDGWVAPIPVSEEVDLGDRSMDKKTRVRRSGRSKPSGV